MEAAAWAGREFEKAAIRIKQARCLRFSGAGSRLFGEARSHGPRAKDEIRRPDRHGTLGGVHALTNRIYRVGGRKKSVVSCRVVQGRDRKVERLAVRLRRDCLNSEMPGLLKLVLLKTVLERPFDAISTCEE